MKLQELLNPFLNSLNVAISQLEFFNRNYNLPPAGMLLASTLIEADYLIHHIRVLINKTDFRQEASPINLQPYRDLLAVRWSYIRSTPLAYTESHKEKATELLLLLAKTIAPVFQTSYYQLMMPTLEVLEDSFGNHIDELHLYEFKLSDDQKRFIHIGFCLEMAENDGILKHTTHFEGEHYVGFYRHVKPLSANECQRIINYSPLTINYWRAIERIVAVKHKGMSFGAFVQRLVNSLINGGRVAQGSLERYEFNSGAAANVGMVEFSTFLDALTLDEKKLLKTKNKVLNPLVRSASDQKSIQHYIDLLFNPAELKPTEDEDALRATYQKYDAYGLGVRFCVEQIADKLQTILNDNPQLFNVKLSNQALAGDVVFDQELRDSVVKHRDAFMSRNCDRYAIQVDESRPGDIHNLAQIIMNLTIHTLDHCFYFSTKYPHIPRIDLLMPLSKQNIASVIPHRHALAKLLAWLPKNDHERFLTNKLDKQFILHLIPDYQTLTALNLPRFETTMLIRVLNFQVPRPTLKLSAVPSQLFSKDSKARTSSAFDSSQPPTKLQRRC